MAFLPFRSATSSYLQAWPPQFGSACPVTPSCLNAHQELSSHFPVSTLSPHLDMEAGEGDVGSACGAPELQLLLCQRLRVPLLPWWPATEGCIPLLEGCTAQAHIAFQLDQVGLKDNISGVLPKQSHEVL